MAAKIRDFFYIQATPNDNNDYPILYGYTENEWMARQFYKSVSNNKLIIETFSSKEEAMKNIVFFRYRGSLEEFHNVIRQTFGTIITGEDIIGTFPTDVYRSNPSNVHEEVVATCGDVLGGGFLSYAERFLFPIDKYSFINYLYLIMGSVGLIKDTNIQQDLLGMNAVLVKHPFLNTEDNVPFIPEGNSSEVIDIIRYGIWKGWYMVV